MRHQWPRAVITGLGIVSPIGSGRDEFARGLREARTGIGPITWFDTAPFRTRFGGQVARFRPEDSLSKEEISLYSDRYIQYAIVAAKEALADSGLSWSRQRPTDSKAGIAVGTCNGGLQTLENQYETELGQQSYPFEYRTKLQIRYHGVGKALSHYFGVSGPAITVTTACASSTTALGIALELISQGIVDTMLVGGADALCMSTMAGFDALGATAPGRTAPFSKPAGINLGEGAAFWVIENLSTAESRGIPILGEVEAYASTSDAHHLTAPDPRGDGAYRTMNSALERSGLQLSDIGYINAHGTGTDANDRTESRAISRLSGPQKIPVSSFKSQVGHCLGATGILEASAGLISMGEDFIPATINFSTPRAGCDIDCVSNTPRRKTYHHFLSCNYAFGGNNAGVIIGKLAPGGEHHSPSRAAGDPVITGFGIVSPLGVGITPSLLAITSGQNYLSPVVNRFPKQPSAYLGGLVTNLDPRKTDRRLSLKGMNPISCYATLAARWAIEEAAARVGPKEGKNTGFINGVCEGPSEESHLRAAIASGGAQTHISTFSQVVANATAGQVCTALLLKGYTATIAQGADAGLFALALAHLAIRSRSADRILAGAADEIIERTLTDFQKLQLLRSGENGYRLDPEGERSRLLGEGAAYLMIEDRALAEKRSAPIHGKIAGFAASTDYEVFETPSRESAHLEDTIQQALEMAGWSASAVGAVIWSPTGTRYDVRILHALEKVLGHRAETVPLLTTVCHTGLCESASGTMALALTLGAFARGEPLWPQITGCPSIDSRPLPASPVPLLVIGTGDEGYNVALAIEPNCGGE